MAAVFGVTEGNADVGVGATEGATALDSTSSAVCKMEAASARVLASSLSASLGSEEDAGRELEPVVRALPVVR